MIRLLFISILTTLFFWSCASKAPENRQDASQPEAAEQELHSIIKEEAVKPDSLAKDSLKDSILLKQNAGEAEPAAPAAAPSEALKKEKKYKKAYKKSRSSEAGAMDLDESGSEDLDDLEGERNERGGTVITTNN